MRIAAGGGANPTLLTLVTLFTVVVVLVGGCSSDEPDDPTAFCDALAEAVAISPTAPLDLNDPTSVADAMAELDQLVALAPDVVADDVTIVAEVYGEVLSAVASTAPGARSDVLVDLQPRLDEVSEPAARLQTYGAATCTVTFDAPAQPTPTPTPLDIDD